MHKSETNAIDLLYCNKCNADFHIQQTYSHPHTQHGKATFSICYLCTINFFQYSWDKFTVPIYPDHQYSEYTHCKLISFIIGGPMY
jgi:hypothetical protein